MSLLVTVYIGVETGSVISFQVWATESIAEALLAEQSGEGPSNRGILRSAAIPKLSFRTEESGEGPGNGGETHISYWREGC